MFDQNKKLLHSLEEIKQAFVACAVAAENYYICVLPLAHLEYLMG